MKQQYHFRIWHIYLRRKRLEQELYSFSVQMLLSFEGVKIYRLSFVDTYASNHKFPIFVRYSNNVTIRDNDMEDCINEVGIFCQAVQKATIKDCTLTNVLGVVQVMSYNPLASDDIHVSNVTVFGTTFNRNSVKIFVCYGNPNGVVTGYLGSIALNFNGGANTTLYVKESGVIQIRVGLLNNVDSMSSAKQ